MTANEPNPDCPECAEQLDYDTANAVFACGNEQCACYGIERPVWSALEKAGILLAPVTGLPRPTRQGFPVPWVTPWTAGRVWWRAMDSRLLARAHNEWRCQVCGAPLAEQAWVLATPAGVVLQAALHQECRDLARVACPHLSGQATRSSAHLVTRAQLASDGRPLLQAQPSDPYFLQQWELAALPGQSEHPHDDPSGPAAPAPA
ncbi:hypothetical protein MHW47_05920 [Streptomyces sp. OfavH-34-F]|uniref:hypothetical protein n=1 Tax=Streptomyces sp. OfavH-34-F TaxID=2917760 RepID=UPI001EF24A83|nr:hypothetical protein [Streptomyces sp. OfavH-34-F]MCG7523978.1 hypothetical protein [Streptomyces sp. OfavH-34-F]